MTKVRASKEYQWRVVKHRPRLYLCLGVALVVLMAVLLQAAFWFGQTHSSKANAIMKKELALAVAELNDVRANGQDLRRQLERALLGTEVDRQALEDVRLELLNLKTQMAALDEENQFYRNLMAPAGNKRGLNFGAVEVADTDQPRTYRYKVVMQQLATQHELINGALSFNIVGRQGGEVTVLGLHEVSGDVDSSKLKLRFKYFQNIEGQLILPPGFEPERIELQASSTGKNATTIDKRLGWLVQERPAKSNS